jgi:integrase/recombinase XerD
MKHKHLSPKQAKAVLQGLKELRADPYALILELLLRSGCRTEETLKIKSNDIDLSNGLIFIHACKGSKSHQVPVDKEFLTHLKAFIGDNELQGMFKNLTPASLKRTLRRQWAKWRFKLLGTGLDHVTLHGLRASFATLIYKNTKDILLVQELLGHKSIGSTMHYIKLTQMEENKSEILKAIG